MSTVPDFHRCPCGWQMIATAHRAIMAHSADCPAVPKPEAPPLNVEQVIDDAARGKAPAHPLNSFERATVLHRMLTMPPGEFFERVFRQPLLEELDRDAAKDASK